MLFNSFIFLIFFPLTLVVYFCLPEKTKNVWLLIASYIFYMCWEPIYVLLLLFATLFTYAFGILTANKRSKKLLVVGILVNMSCLAYYKYAGFGMELLTGIINSFGGTMERRTIDIFLPVGISFFTFQTTGYLIDVYRGQKPEKNIFTYALFVSFFPQLVAGPIERSKRLISQISTSHKFEIENLQRGFLLMLWGYYLYPTAKRFANSLSFTSIKIRLIGKSFGK